MVESICYVKLSELPGFLERMVGMLNQNGLFVFRLHDLVKHREYVETALRLYPQTEQVDQNLFCIPLLKGGDDPKGSGSSKATAR